jgi:hypothetical protein
MRHALLTCLVLLTGLPANATEQRWRCELSADLVRLHCASTEPAPADREPPEAVAQVGGTRFPLDPRRSWTVELWSPPNERAFVELLARATICYRTPRCSVEVDLRAMNR